MNITITPEQFQKLDLMVCMPCYGGLIQGVCAQSLMELQGLCAQYGVKFRIQFLMSESLISRARTYLTDAFMRSPCTHMLFVDADIQFSAKDILTMIGIQISNEGDNNYDIVSAPYSKKCLHASANVLTPDGYKTIAELEASSYRGKVMSMNTDGVFEWKDVLDVWKNQNTYHKEWVSVPTPLGDLFVTEDHEVYYEDDKGFGTLPAIEMAGKVPVVYYAAEHTPTPVIPAGQVKYCEVEDGDWLYDMTVADNANFIVNDILVHNCISYEKIKQAVDMGVADNDPGILKEYVGDFVFNVAGVSQQRPMTLADLQEPMEVSETGTGMMLIRRKTLERWEKGHEDRLYYPDHARTADFNGHRQIYQYFAVNLVQTDPNNPQSKRLLSEDYLFCWEVRQLGMHVWMCPWMRLGHVGTMTYGGSLIEMAKIGASMTVDPTRIKDGYVQKQAALSSDMEKNHEAI